jgi:hypothetical protein
VNALKFKESYYVAKIKSMKDLSLRPIEVSVSVGSCCVYLRLLTRAADSLKVCMMWEARVSRGVHARCSLTFFRDPSC